MLVTSKVNLGQMAASEVKLYIDSLLHDEILVVNFTKVLGLEERTMLCTLRKDLLPATDPSKVKKEKDIPDEVPARCVVWDLQAQGWRSFRCENINMVAVVTATRS